MTLVDGIVVVTAILGSIFMIAELVLLVKIWLDGKKMLEHEAGILENGKKVFELYERYFEKREMEKQARNEAQRKARAAKKGQADAPVSETAA